MARKYDSPARREAKQGTRERILDAVVDVVTREGVHAFTVQNVADAAGVAHRTVYRHFATREDLLDGLDDLLQRRGVEAGFPVTGPWKLDDLRTMVGEIYQGFDAFKDAMRAYVVISIALGRRVPGFDERSRAMRAHIADAFPGLSHEDVENAAAVMRLLVSTRTWFLLTTEQDMSTTAASQAVSRAIEALFADLSARSKNRTT
jgi:AcrR family transcriptional regulator